MDEDEEEDEQDEAGDLAANDAKKQHMKTLMWDLLKRKGLEAKSGAVDVSVDTRLEAGDKIIGQVVGMSNDVNEEKKEEFKDEKTGTRKPKIFKMYSEDENDNNIQTDTEEDDDE